MNKCIWIWFGYSVWVLFFYYTIKYFPYVSFILLLCTSSSLLYYSLSNRLNIEVSLFLCSISCFCLIISGFQEFYIQLVFIVACIFSPVVRFIFVAFTDLFLPDNLHCINLHFFHKYIICLMHIFSHVCLATSCLKQVIFSWFVILMCNSFFVHFLSGFGLDIENTGRWSLMSFMSKPLQVSQFDWYVNVVSINVALEVVIRLCLYINWYKPNLSSWSIK